MALVLSAEGIELAKGHDEILLPRNMLIVVDANYFTGLLSLGLELCCKKGREIAKKYVYCREYGREACLFSAAGQKTSILIFHSTARVFQSAVVPWITDFGCRKQQKIFPERRGCQIIHRRRSHQAFCGCKKRPNTRTSWEWMFTKKAFASGSHYEKKMKLHLTEEKPALTWTRPPLSSFAAMFWFQIP